MVEEKIAYAAGLIDGEAYLKLRNRGYVHSEPLLQIKMTDIQPLLYVQTLFGGTIAESRWYRRAGYKPQWVWRISGALVIDALIKLQPYLKTSNKIIVAAEILDYTAHHQTCERNRWRPCNAR